MFTSARDHAPAPSAASGLCAQASAASSWAPAAAGAASERGFRSCIGDLRGIAVAYFVGTAISGALVTQLGMRFPSIPGSPSRDHVLLAAFAASLVLAASLVPLARGVSGAAASRFFALAAFTYVLFAVVTQIEAALFTDFGGTGTMLTFFLLPCLLAAGTATVMIRPPSAAPRIITAFSPLHGGSWWWRAALAWLAYPICTVAFGVALSPLIGSLVAREAPGIAVPSPFLVAVDAAVRGLLMLAVTIPILRRWTRSRLALILSLGLSYFVLTGLVGLVQATWWGPSLRIVLAAQVLAMSMAHAWIVVALLAPRRRAMIECRAVGR